jgi:hypothetical protein
MKVAIFLLALAGLSSSAFASMQYSCSKTINGHLLASYGVIEPTGTATYTVEEDNLVLATGNYSQVNISHQNPIVDGTVIAAIDPNKNMMMLQFNRVYDLSRVGTYKGGLGIIMNKAATSKDFERSLDCEIIVN